MSEEEPTYFTGRPPEGILQPKIVVAPADIDVSPHVSVHMKGPPLAAFWAMSSLGHSIQDFAKFTAQIYLINRLKNEFVPNAAEFPKRLSYMAKTLTPDQLAKEVLTTINTDYDYLMYAWNTGLQTGIGAAFSSAQEQFMNSGQLLYAYGAMQYQVSIAPRMRRYWMKEYTPTIPNTSMAFNLMRRGKITLQQFTEYASYDGWDSKGIDQIKQLWKAIPNEHIAFRMMMRGAIDSKTKESIYYANSWEKEDFDKLDSVYQWLPNAREGFSLFKRGHIKEEDMISYFRAQGYMPFYDKVLPKIWERLPTPRDAFTMLMRDVISAVDFKKYVAANEWEKGSAERLLSIYENLPEERQAFTLFKRGKINQDSLNWLFKTKGYMPIYQKLLPSLFERIPQPRDAFNALMRGVIDKKQFDKYVEANEWQDGSSDFLYDIYTRLPSSREAFYMWVKGIITLAQYHELLTASGYETKWHMQIINNSYYVPTVYDLTRIADFVEVDLIWATKILGERGLRAGDISKIVKMLKIRPLRDEIRRQIAIWVYRYRYGWVTATQLDAALQQYLEDGYIQSTEKTMTVEEAELNYENELMLEKIDIYSWYYRTAVISEEELLQDFLDLGIREEKANLMVEDLKAQGYYGYY
jgi:hypothetical protein